MSLSYEIFYRVGFTPWEAAAESGRAAAQLNRLLEREGEERARPPGRMLDLGCGTGYHTRALAARGWDAVGVDNVALALKKAGARSENSTARFVSGDVTRLGDLDLGTFDFFLDVGCFHGLKRGQRQAMADGVTALANPDATLLTLCFRRNPLPFGSLGATEDDVANAFSRWAIIHQEPADLADLNGPARKAEPQLYRLRLR